MNVYENLGTRAPTDTSTIPGDASASQPGGSTWRLRSLRMPSQFVMETLVEIYFERSHWFIFILHKPSFVGQVRQLLSFPSWQRKDMGKVLLTLMVAAIGLKCAIQDTSGPGKRLLAQIHTDPGLLIDQFVDEVRIHLLDLLDDSCIETVQVCLLLGSFYIFHGSPSLAWAMIGLSARTSYALALHCDPGGGDEIAAETRRRCWNHLTVADTFASQIYGRPASIDPAFSDLLPLTEMDDTAINLSSDPRIQESAIGSVTGLTFHILKYKLYEITRNALSTFRVLQLHNPISAEELKSLIDTVQHIDGLLKQWKEALPPLFKTDSERETDSIRLSAQERIEDDEFTDSGLRQLKLQACVLQLTYDAAIILVHRPLLEHKLSPEYRQGISKSTRESLSRSFDVSVKAALRISWTPIMQFKSQFCLAFIFVHLFTAGVILCIPPTSHPFSNTAQEAKAGVLRIIRASKLTKEHSQIASHTERLLKDLLKLSVQREIALALTDEPESDHGASSRQPPAEHASINEQHGHDLPSDRHNQALALDSASGTPFNSSHPQSMPNENPNLDAQSQIPDLNADKFDDKWVEPYLFLDNVEQEDGTIRQQLDSQLDETFGAFGQGKKPLFYYTA